MNTVLVQCSRCKRSIEGIRDEICTGWFYDTSKGDWAKLADPDEDIICDGCMHWDARYQKVYGEVKGFSINGLSHIKNFTMPFGFTEQWKEFLQYYPDAQYTVSNGLADDNTYEHGVWFAQIAYTDYKIPKGWNKTELQIRFLIPFGYPVAQPKSFWTNVDLRTEDNRHPMQSNPRPDVLGNMGLWVAWKSEGWNPNHDTLLTFSRVIRQRFNITG